MTASEPLVRVVLMTVPSVETGAEIVGRLVDERLAACGNVVPGLTSIFRWEGEVQTEPEALVVLKTSASRVVRMIERASELHPYDVPELLALPMTEGHGPYLRWVLEETEER